VKRNRHRPETPATPPAPDPVAEANRVIAQKKAERLAELEAKFRELAGEIEAAGFRLSVHQDYDDGVPGPMGFRIVAKG